MSLDEAGYCLRCHTREGPVHAHGLLYYFCMAHRLRWTVPAGTRNDSAEALAAARVICQKTVPVVDARSWRPAAGPVRR